jgi:hypothetical protein
VGSGNAPSPNVQGIEPGSCSEKNHSDEHSLQRPKSELLQRGVLKREVLKCEVLNCEVLKCEV